CTRSWTWGGSHMRRVLFACALATAWLGALRVDAGDGTTGDDRVAQLEAKLDRAIIALSALETRVTTLERRGTQGSSTPTAPVPAPLTGQPPAPTPPPPPGMSEPSNPDPQEVTAYVTRTGSKYHRAGCSYLK